MKTTCFMGLVLLTTSAAQGDSIAMNDPDGSLGMTRAPVTAMVKLTPREHHAALEGRLQLRELRPSPASASLAVPMQVLESGQRSAPMRVCWLMPPGAKGERRFEVQIARRGASEGMLAKQDAASGQFDITEAGKPVLRYNYSTIEPGDLLEKVTPANLKYARARNNYLHPLYGLDGEVLTRDWPLDHPHHRGIYWAWPEVDWRGQRGDLHALQFVFARPAGKCTATGGPVFAQIEAENIWQWESGESLVQERAVIRAYRAPGDDRMIDLELTFTALKDTVSLARRDTDKYGGLNLRLATVLKQEINFHTDATNAPARMAWAELNGRIDGAPQNSGLVVLQHSANPDYPGDWVKYPELNWLQPTFPASGTRYELKPGEPLVLRFRLWLHRGPMADESRCAAQWRGYHSDLAPTAPANR
ncbi:MAG: PmoA family protein [Verrucomicrobia bacterium]|nr:PmoA family protein [Verrucomicrobiota bacterium]